MTEKKKGLHGIKAFLVIVTSGVLAGLLVVWIGISIIKWAFSSLSGGGFSESGESPEVFAQQTGKAHESLPPEGIDICRLTIQTISRISVTSVESSPDGPEASSEGGVTSYSDVCHWKLVPEYGVSTPWDFSLRYKMIVGIPEGGGVGESAVEVAENEFSLLKDSSYSLFGEIVSEGERGNIDQSYYFYGVAEGDLNVTRYVFVGRVKSTAYQIVFDDRNVGNNGEMVPLSAFQNEINKINSRMAIDLGVWVPD